MNRKLILYGFALMAVLVAAVLNSQVLLALVLLLVLGSEFVNGWTDAPNAIATLIATRVLSTGQAIALAVVGNFLGTLAGTAVAETLGKDIIDPSAVSLLTIGSALVGIIVWSSLAAFWGIPTSESHALIAGLSGAAMATAGWGALQWAGWKKALIGIPSSLLLGFGITWLVCRVVIRLFANASPRTGSKAFNISQGAAGAVMAFAHGMNDGQKFMGIFVLALMLGGVYDHFHLPMWIRLLCAGVMGLGTSVGGKAIIGTMGEKIVKGLESWQGFAALTGSSLTVLLASAFGVPLSTTHTIVAAVTGAGASRSPSTVRWQHPRRILYAAAATFPLCAAISFVVCAAFQALQALLVNK